MNFFFYPCVANVLEACVAQQLCPFTLHFKVKCTLTILCKHNLNSLV